MPTWGEGWERRRPAGFHRNPHAHPGRGGNRAVSGTVTTRLQEDYGTGEEIHPDCPFGVFDPRIHRVRRAPYATMDRPGQKIREEWDAAGVAG